MNDGTALGTQSSQATTPMNPGVTELTAEAVNQLIGDVKAKLESNQPLTREERRPFLDLEKHLKNQRTSLETEIKQYVDRLKTPDEDILLDGKKLERAFTRVDESNNDEIADGSYEMDLGSDEEENASELAARFDEDEEEIISELGSDQEESTLELDPAVERLNRLNEMEEEHDDEEIGLGKEQEATLHRKLNDARAKLLSANAPERISALQSVSARDKLILEKARVNQLSPSSSTSEKSSMKQQLTDKAQLAQATNESAKPRERVTRDPSFLNLLLDANFRGRLNEAAPLPDEVIRKEHAAIVKGQLEVLKNAHRKEIMSLLTEEERTELIEQQRQHWNESLKDCRQKLRQVKDNLQRVERLLSLTPKTNKIQEAQQSQSSKQNSLFVDVNLSPSEWEKEFKIKVINTLNHVRGNEGTLRDADIEEIAQRISILEAKHKELGKKSDECSKRFKQQQRAMDVRHEEEKERLKINFEEPTLEKSTSPHERKENLAAIDEQKAQQENRQTDEKHRLEAHYQQLLLRIKERLTNLESMLRPAKELYELNQRRKQTQAGHGANINTSDGSVTDQQKDTEQLSLRPVPPLHSGDYLGEEDKQSVAVQKRPRTPSLTETDAFSSIEPLIPSRYANLENWKQEEINAVKNAIKDIYKFDSLGERFALEVSAAPGTVEQLVQQCNKKKVIYEFANGDMIIANSAAVLRNGELKTTAIPKSVIDVLKQTHNVNNKLQLEPGKDAGFGGVKRSRAL